MVVTTIIVSSIKNNVKSPAERYAWSLNIEPHKFWISEGSDKISKHLAATYPEVDLILEFSQVPEQNRRLCQVLGFIKKNRDANGKMRPAIRQVILCYENSISKELVECQNFCSEHNIPYNIVWSELFKSLLEIEESSQFDVINLRINMEEVPKAQPLTKKPKSKHELFSPMLVPESLADMVYRKRIVDEKLWYWDEKAAAAYLYLKESRGYSVFKQNYHVLQSHIGEIIRASVDSLSSWGTKPTTKEEPYSILDFVALGVGSAEKELLILGELLDFYRAEDIELGPQKRVYYTPVDTSFPLLQNSLRTLLSHVKFNDALAEKKLEVNPILTDFFKLHRKTLKGNRKKLIAALGLLWNVPAHLSFSTIKENLLNEDSLLLIDVEFIGGRNEDEIASSYKGKDSNEFFFHSLELLNQAALSDNTFKTSSAWGSRVTKPYQIFREYSLKKGDIKIEVVDSSEIKSLRDKYNLPRMIEDYLRFEKFENTKTVVIIYAPKSDKANPVVLGYTTRYDLRELVNCIKDNFEIVKQYYDEEHKINKSTVGYFLLKYRP